MNNGYRFSHTEGEGDEALACYVPAQAAPVVRYTIRKPGEVYRPKAEAAITDELPRPSGATQWRIQTLGGTELGVVWGTHEGEAVCRALRALELGQGVERGHYSPAMLRATRVDSGIVSGSIITRRVRR